MDSIEAEETPSQKPPRRKCAKWRMLLRLFAAFVLLPPLLVLGWLNIFGVPEFLHPKITRIANQKGMVVEFESLHFNILSGIYIRSGNISSRGSQGQIDLAFDTARLRYAMGLSGFRPSGLQIESGALLLSSTNGPMGNRNTWTLCRNIQAQIDFNEAQVTRVEQFSGDFDRGSINFSGTVTNAWAALDAMPESEDGTTLLSRVGKWMESSDEFQSMMSRATPEISIRLDGDALRPHTINASSSIELERLDLPWATLAGIALSTRLSPRAKEEEEPDIVTDIHVRSVSFPAGDLHSLDQLNLEAELWLDPHGVRPRRIRTSVSANEAFIGGETPAWADYPEVYIDAIRNGSESDWMDIANWNIQSGFECIALRLESIGIDSENLAISAARLHSPDDAGGQTDLSIHVSWDFLGLSDIEIAGSTIRIPTASTTGIKQLIKIGTDTDPAAWVSRIRAAVPELTAEFSTLSCRSIPVGDMAIAVGGNDISSPWTAQLQLKVTDSESIRIGTELGDSTLRLTGESDTDVKRWLPLLPDKVKEVAGRIHWDEAPETVFTIGPAPMPESISIDSLMQWFSTEANFHGSFSLGSGNFKMIPFQTLKGSYSYRDDWWYLSPVKVERLDGPLDLEFRQNNDTGLYTVDLKGPIRAASLRPLFDENADLYFDRIRESGPMVGNVIVGGPWDEGHGTITGKVSHDSITWNDVNLDRLEAEINYLDRLKRLDVSNALVEAGGESVSAGSVSLEWNRRSLSFDNMRALCRPSFAASLISGESKSFIAPYDLEEPAHWAGNGSLEFMNEVKPDIHLSVSGPVISFKELGFQNFSTMVHWTDTRLNFEKFRCHGYDGSLLVDLGLDFATVDDPAIHMQASGLEIDTRLLSKEFKQDSEIQGLANFNIRIDAGRAQSPDTWSGKGTVIIEDGVLWDIPVFGRLSQTMDSIIKGIGHSRINRATMDFELNGGTIQFRKCRFDGTQFGINLEGQLTTSGEIDATARARMFQAENPVERLLNLTLSPVSEGLCYEITGDLKSPSIKPRYIIPRVLLNPLAPGEWFRSDRNGNGNGSGTK